MAMNVAYLTDQEALIRAAAMDWLSARIAREQETVTRAELAAWEYEGIRIPLVDRGRGIRKPRGFESALSITTTYTPAGRRPPYEDNVGGDGLLRYKYRLQQPNHADNIALRQAYFTRSPLIWFFGVASGVFIARFPVWIIADDPVNHEATIAVDEVQKIVDFRNSNNEDQRRYVERITRQRIHQPLFRARVLQAYDHKCTICQITHTRLLDAAHILEDSRGGQPIVSNGLPLCKIHHSAYDANILGISPDLIVKVRSDILLEVDGPMLKHGIQAMDGLRIVTPRERAAQPSKENLDVRYSDFLKA